MNIGFVATESPYSDRSGGGIAAYLRAVIPALLDAGQRVTLFAGADEERSFLAENGRLNVHHFRLPSAHWYLSKVPVVRSMLTLPLRQIEWSYTFYRKVASVAAREKFDVLESTEAGSLFLSRLAPLVVRLHGSEFVFRKHMGVPIDVSVRCNDLLEAYACKRAAAITTPSKFQAEESTKRRAWSAERVQVVANPISARLLKAASEFHRNGNTERTVLYTGRLAPVKGIETLLEAAKLVHNQDPSINFVLAGPWQMPRSPEAYGLQLDRKSDFGVKWIGPQNEDEIISLYQRAALFVMPSYFESFGISVVEALAFGLPVVATNTSGLAEVLGTGSGSLVPKGAVKEFAAAVINSLAVKRAYSDGAEQLPARVTQFAPDKIAAEAINIYEAASSERSRMRREFLHGFAS